jgi:putative NIF3 family GTP cyclohydrolase 1 type 2
VAPTIQQVIDAILQTVPEALLPDTVDTFKAGDPSRPVTGIVTTFMSTFEVVRQAAALGANLVITHEPTFYNHLDKVDWLKNDPVYQAKRRFLDEHQITVWRFHDHWHQHRPDGILTGAVRLLGWEQYQDPENAHLFSIPPTTLSSLVALLKEKLDASTARVVGSSSLVCSRVALLPGSPPGEQHVRVLGQNTVDVLVGGEAPEWQTYEYVRDAVSLGLGKGLVMLGHEKSEEPGMAYLAGWLRSMFPEVDITHVPSGEPVALL